MKYLSAIFTPFAEVSRLLILGVIFSQIGFALMYWQFAVSAVIPTPFEIFGAIGTIWENGFGYELGVSIKLCLEALLISSLVSLLFSYLTVTSFFRPLATAMAKGRFLSLIGFSFLFALMTTGGHQLKLLMMVVGMSTFFVMAMMAIVDSIPKAEYDYARTLRMGPWEVVWEVIIRGKLGDAIEIMRQIFAIGFMMLPMVEGISRAEGGVGKFLLDSNKHFLLADIFAVQLVMFTLGLLIDYGLGMLNKTINPHAFITRERQ